MTIDRSRSTARDRAWPRMAATVGLVTAALALAVLSGTVSMAPLPSRTWTFESTSDDPATLGFQLSSRETGDWLVVDHEGAGGKRALVNLAGVPGAKAASAVVRDSVTRDLEATTRCMPAAESTGAACGLVFRYLDAANYYVARVDARKGVVALAVVVGSVERTIRAATSDASPARWQELSVVAQGDHLVVGLNGQTLVDVHDLTLPSAGRVGVWAPADGEVYFDELSFAVLPATRAHPSDLLPILLRRRT